MEYPLSPDALQYIEGNRETLINLLVALCRIPAPSGREERRAAFIQSWLEANGAAGAYTDKALNVIYSCGCEDAREITVFAAHTDTVFSDMEPMPLVMEDRRMLCPGVGDDTANLAVLLMVIKYVCERKLTPKHGVLFVANSCEEGLGNLKGSRQIAVDFGDRMREFVSFDGYYDSVCNKAVGSCRYRVEIRTEGGHSYGSFGNRNAIQAIAALINALYAVAVPEIPGTKTTYNVGLINGGTSVNTIAQQAEILYEYRSDSAQAMDQMRGIFDQIIEKHRAAGITINLELLGERPGMGPVDEEKEQALVDKCRDIIERYTGIRPPVRSSSTDCNIPLSMGIPAVCTGAVLGGGAHTREEWIETNSLQTGFQIAAALVLDNFYQ